MTMYVVAAIGPFQSERCQCQSGEGSVPGEWGLLTGCTMSSALIRQSEQFCSSSWIVFWFWWRDIVPVWLQRQTQKVRVTLWSHPRLAE